MGQQSQQFSADWYLHTYHGVLRYADLPGSGVPIVFIHGLGCASTLDYAQVATLDGLAQYRRLLVDLPGSGQSAHPCDFDYSITGHARHLDRFLTHLGMTQVVLFGHSMGGAVVTSLAELNTERVAGVILTESNLDPGGGTWSRTIAHYSETEFTATEHARLVAQTQELPEYESWSRTLAQSWPAALHREAVSLIAGTSPSWRETLYRLTCPRFFIFGSQNLPDPDAEELPRHGIHVMTVPQAGHNMGYENPTGLAQVLTTCLNQITELRDETIHK